MRDSSRGTLISFLFITLFFLFGDTAAAGRTILVLGDSLSAAHGIETGAGWVTLLQQRLDKQQSGYQVVNASISGDTTANALARLPPLLAQHQPAIVIVELGGNDGLRGLPVDQMKRNLVSIITKARAHDAKLLLAGVHMPPNYGKRYTEMFQHAYREVATEQRIALVPSIMEGIALDRTLMQSDQIHPNAEAQGKILDNIWPTLRPLL